MSLSAYVFMNSENEFMNSSELKGNEIFPYSLLHALNTNNLFIILILFL